MKPSTLVVSILTAFGAHSALAQPPAATPPVPCTAADKQWVCGQNAPEDLLPLPGEKWIVAGAYSGTGGIALVNVADRSSTTVFPSASAKQQPDKKTYPDCPGPPTGVFQTHGLYLAPGSGPVLQLMAVGHGARESIEVFQVDTRPATPSFTWVGCVIAPEPIGLNSVRGLPDGGFITTNFLPRGGGAPANQKMMAGEKNGELWEWHTTSGWQKLPGTEAAGANGVELSDDGKTLYIAAWGSQSFIRVTHGVTPGKREEIPLGFRIDNIHFAKDGTLFGVGQALDAKPPTWKVVKIDPKTLAVHEVMNVPNNPAFGNGTVAAEIGKDLWVGTFRGDRIVIVPAP